MPGSGVTLPLDLHAIAARCTNAYYAPRRFAAVQFAFNNPRCRVLIFHTGRLVGTGCSGPMAARMAILKAARQLAVEANVHVHIRKFSVINQVGAVGIDAKLDCDAFASTHSATSHYDRASFVGVRACPNNRRPRLARSLRSPQRHRPRVAAGRRVYMLRDLFDRQGQPAGLDATARPAHVVCAHGLGAAATLGQARGLRTHPGAPADMPPAEGGHARRRARDCPLEGATIARRARDQDERPLWQRCRLAARAPRSRGGGRWRRGRCDRRWRGPSGAGGVLKSSKSAQFATFRLRLRAYASACTR